MNTPTPTDDTDDKSGDNPISMDDFANALKSVTSYQPPEPYRADNNAPPVAEQNRKWKMVKLLAVFLLPLITPFPTADASIDKTPQIMCAADERKDYVSKRAGIDDDDSVKKPKKPRLKPFRVGDRIGDPERVLACNGCTGIQADCDVCFGNELDTPDTADD